MNDKNAVINRIYDLLGSEGSRELAEAMFDIASSDDRIYWASDYEGLVMSPDLDLDALAVEAMAKVKETDHHLVVSLGDGFTNVFVGDHKDHCFTINHLDMEWGASPEDNRPTWEHLCKVAGLDPDNAVEALNEATGLAGR